MPLLAGGLLADASGSQVQDASASNVGEGTLFVAVHASSLLYDARMPMAGPWYLPLVEIIVGAVADALLARGDDGLGELQTAVDDALYELQGPAGSINGLHLELSAISGQGANDLQDVLDAVAAIEPGGGLTTEEHDHLVGLANVNTEQLVGDIWGYVIAVDDLRP